MKSEKGLIAKRFLKLREEKEQIEIRLAEIKAELEKLNEKLVEAMDAEDEQSFKLTEGLFYQSTDFYTTVMDKTKLFEWLKTHKLFNQLAKVDVNTNTLKSWIKERMSNNKIYPTVEEGVNAYYKTTVKFRKG